jgi:hypothetical protein
MKQSTKNELAREQAQGRLAHLRQCYQTGDDVALDDVFEAAGLTAQEQHILRQRLAGQSFGEVAAGTCTRQNVQIIEATATAKLGLRQSLAEAVHRNERIDRALDMVERGERVRAVELHLDPEQVRPRLQRRVAQWERAHEAAVQAFLAEVERV